MAKKKGLQTPDHSGDPATASTDSMKPGGGEGGGGGVEVVVESSVDEVLKGPDIEALRIREEDLRKVACS